MTLFQRPTPDEVQALREACPEGTPRFSYREMVVDRASDNAPADTLRIAISSEAPVLRYDWWADETYYEVLDHAPRSVDLSYADDGMPFVMSHMARDGNQQFGIIENITVDKDRVMRGDVRFSRSVRAQEIAQDMRDGIRKKISVGYIVGDEYDQTEKASDGVPIRRYTNWMPIEGSTVPIPADYSVGVGRDLSDHSRAALARYLTLHPARGRASESANSTPLTAPDKAKETRMAENATASNGAADDKATPTVDVKAIREQALSDASKQIKAIRDIAVLSGKPEIAEAWLRDGITTEKAMELARGMIDERAKAPIQTAHVELTEKDRKRFSFARAMLVGTPLGEKFAADRSQPGVKVDFGFEKEVQEEARRLDPNTTVRGGFIPYAAMMTNQPHVRAIESGTTGAAFKFNQPGEFIDLLRNSTSVMRAGATVLTGLTGPLVLPKQTSAGNTSWSAENPGTDIAATDSGFGSLTLSFKSLARVVTYTRQMLFSAASGNYSIDSLLRDDVLRTIGLGIDLGALNGTGSNNQPQGLLKNTSIGSVTLGTAGGSAVWSTWVNLETAVAQNNGGVSRLAYITNAQQRGKAKQNAVLANTASGVPIWSGGGNPDFDGLVNGYPAFVSQQVPATLTKGSATTCSGIAFGAFDQMLIGMFGPGIETIPDETTLAAQGLIRLVCWSYLDVGLRHPESFAACLDAL